MLHLGGDVAIAVALAICVAAPLEVMLLRLLPVLGHILAARVVAFCAQAGGHGWLTEARGSSQLTMVALVLVPDLQHVIEPAAAESMRKSASCERSIGEENCETLRTCRLCSVPCPIGNNGLWSPELTFARPVPGCAFCNRTRCSGPSPRF